MMSQPLVSIITPVYNAAPYLQETIESVLSQTYAHWELILVDDCSEDNSLAILREFAAKDLRIKVYTNEANSKAFYSRNRALSASNGSFIAFLDADDLWEPNKLELQVEFMLQQDSWFTYTDFDRFVKDPMSPTRIEKLPNFATYQKILTNNYVATSTVIVWRSKIGDFLMKDVYYDDFLLWLDLLKRVANGRKIAHNLMHYRITKNSLSKNKLKSAKEVYGMFTRKMGFSYVRGLLYFMMWGGNTTLRYLR